MEWVLIMLMNSTDGGQISQSPAVIPGFSSEEKCKHAGQGISKMLIKQAGQIRNAKAPGEKWLPPYVWSECVLLAK
jgi:hypothetical protein